MFVRQAVRMGRIGTSSALPRWSLIAFRSRSLTVASSATNISSTGGAVGRPRPYSRKATHLSCKIRQLSSASSSGPEGAGTAGGEEVSYMQIEKDLAAMQRSIRDLHGHGDYAGSLSVAKQALEVSRNHFGEQHPVTASLLNNIALNQKYLGDVDAAIGTFKQALEMYEAVLGETHTSCATCKINIAKLLQLQANHVPGLDRMQLLQEAKEIAEEALVVKLDNLGDRNPEVGTVMFSLGAIYNDLKMHDEAVETLVEAVALLEGRLGADHPSVATARNNLGYTYKQMERFDAALTEYEKALAIRENTFGPGHAHVIASKQNMAELLRAMGREDRALELQQDIIATVELMQQQQQQQQQNAQRGNGEKESSQSSGIVRPVDGFFDPNREV